jgi:hypothetical protein
MDYKNSFLNRQIVFSQIPADIKTREFILSIADGVSLDQIPEYIDDDEIVLKIIKKEGRNIKYISPRLQHDETIAIAFIQFMGENISWMCLLPLDMLRNLSFARKALAIQPKLLSYFPFEFQDDPEIRAMLSLPPIPETEPTTTKSVTIHITLHGTDLDNRLDPTLPMNTMVSGSVGLCKFITRDKSNVLLQKLTYLEKLYTTRSMRDANKYYARTYHNSTSWESNVRVLREVHPTGDIKEMYTRPTTTALRQYKHDHKYENNFDMLNLSRGIFIVHSTVPLPPYTGDIPILSREEGSIDLHRQNLMNAVVANHFLPGGFEAVGAVIRPFEGSEKVDQYAFLTLTHILSFFQRLGFDHVNILDESCRVDSVPRTPEIQREQSAEEMASYPIGGKQTKRKQTKRKRTKRRSS